MNKTLKVGLHVLQVILAVGAVAGCYFWHQRTSKPQLDVPAVIDFLVAFSAALLADVLIEQFILESNVTSAEANITKELKDMPSKAIYLHRELDQYRATAETILGACPDVHIVMHEWFLRYAETSLGLGYYSTRLNEGRDESVRLKILKQVLEHARIRVGACSYADPEHVDAFWGNPEAEGYIDAHKNAIKICPVVQRIVIIPQSTQSSQQTEAREHLLKMIVRLWGTGMKDTYWLSESDAHEAIDAHSLYFPYGSFFFADDAFVSEGLYSRDDGSQPKDKRPYFLFTRHPNDEVELKRVKSQFDVLLRKAKQKPHSRLDTHREIKFFAGLLGISDARFDEIFQDSK